METQESKKTVRCKFRCVAIAQTEHWDRQHGHYLHTASFAAADKDKSPENRAFFEATPTVNVQIGTMKADHFSVGREYYVDFTEAGDQ